MNARLSIHHFQQRAAMILLAALVFSPLPASSAAASFQQDLAPVWQGPPPGSGKPDPAALRMGREACITGKQATWSAALSRPASEDLAPLRTEDPLTWYDVTYYDLTVDVRQGASSLEGSTFMELTVLEEGLEALTLHAADNLSIGTVLVNAEQASDITQDGDLLTIGLGQPRPAGTQLMVEIFYEAEFNGCGVLDTWRQNIQTGQSIHTITTQAEPFDARCWWPCKDDTRDKADSVRVHLRTDDFNTAVSNGVLESIIDFGDGSHMFNWFESWPMVTYLVSMCVTEYNHAQVTWNWQDVSMPMHDWSWSLSSGDQQAVMQAGLFALDALSETLGRYPFWNEKYGHAQYTWGGAMEHQTCSSMGFYSESVIAHELAHQWFGDKITCDTFHHIWLNEGWATYCEALYFEYYGGAEALHEVMSYEAYMGPGTIYVENPYTDVIFDGNLSYAKGSWVVHMLRHVMGEEAFWAAVHTYLGPNERPYHRTADTDEFRGFMEAEYGNDLDWFFQQWIYGEYWPDYAYSWEAHPETGWWVLNLALSQVQAPARQTFTMPIDCKVTFAGGASETVVLWNNSAAQAYQLTFAQEPVSVDLDPDRWILSEVEELATPINPNIQITLVRLRDSQGLETDRLPDAGNFTLEIEMVNLGSAVAEVQVSLTDDYPWVYADSSYSLGAFGFGQTRQAWFNGHTIEGLTGMVHFTFTASWAGGDIEQVFSFPAHLPEILLVDDDEGGDYETWFQGAMDGVQNYAIVTQDELPVLSAYQMILWITGDGRRELTVPQWTALQEYMDTGGHLVFTGQHFAESQDPTQLSTHCGLELVSGDHTDTAVISTTEGVFEGRRFYLFNGGAGNQTEMDVIAGQLDCMASQGRYNALPTSSAVQELWCGGSGGLMVFGFGLEGTADIGNGISLAEAIEALLDWSYAGTAVDPKPSTRPGPSFTLLGAHPNPFNPSTRIAWESATAGLLRGEVFNLAGQRVTQLEPREIPAGQGGMEWRAEGLASGLYIVRMELQAVGDGARSSATMKLMLLQ